MKTQARGPAGYENWRAFERGEPRRGGSEVLLCGDARITGDIPELGPHGILNALPLEDLAPGMAAPPLVLRTWWHDSSRGYPNMTETDFSAYHGGDQADELATLMSLALGTRLRATDETRHFSDNDAQGRPRSVAVVAPPSVRGRLRLLPRHGGRRTPVSLDSDFVARLGSYPTLPPSTAVSLARASRSYRDAIWIAEEQPELAWLLLVAALECASNSWRKNISSSHVRLADVHPELAARLQPVCSPEAYSAVERELAPQFKAKAKLLAFCSQFRPRHGPTPQPTRGAFAWADEADVKAALDTIYAHRSRALHEAIPIPAPMCMTPNPYSEEAPTETITALASATRSGAWMRRDTPMLLHAFEWLTRQTLLNWWDSLHTKL